MNVGPDIDSRIAQLLAVFWASRLLIILCSIMGGIVFGVYAFTTQPLYRVDSLLSPVEGQDSGALSQIADSFGGIASLAGMSLSGGRTEESVAILKSRSLGEEFIRDENLIPQIYASQWDATRDEWKPDRADDPPTLQDAYQAFDTRIRTISVDQKSGLVTLSIRWNDPVAAAAWADKLVALANKRIRELQITDASQSLEFLQRELAKADVLELRQAIYQLMENETRRMMLANVREDIAFRVIDPPVVPDADKFESPLRALLIVAGFILGTIAGCLLTLVPILRAAVAHFRAAN